MPNKNVKMIAAALTLGLSVLGISQLASAQRVTPTSTLTTQVKPAQVADVPEANDTPDASGAADPAEAGDTADAVETAEAGDVADTADTDHVQDGPQSGPDVPDAPGSAGK